MTDSFGSNKDIQTRLDFEDAKDQVDFAESYLFFTKLRASVYSFVVAASIALLTPHILVAQFGSGQCKQAIGMQHAPVQTPQGTIWKPASNESIQKFCQKSNTIAYWEWVGSLLWFAIPIGLLLRYGFLAAKVREAKLLLEESMVELADRGYKKE
jgi:hypothetical protein